MNQIQGEGKESRREQEATVTMTMMMISFRSTMILATIGLLALIHLVASTTNQLYRLDSNNNINNNNELHMNPTASGQLLASNQNNNNDNNFLQHQNNHHNIPGHYEFEVAPKMEPPAVRKPPYPQSAQLCPGSGKFYKPIQYLIYY